MVPNLGHIFAALTDYRASGDEPVLSSVVVDSREAISGSLFVALPGEQTNGHEFVNHAFEQGAIAALVEHKSENSFAEIDLRDKDNTAISQWDGTLPVIIIVEDSLNAMQKAAQSWRSQFKVKVIGITGSVGKSSTKELATTVLSQRYRTFKSPGNRNSVLGLPPALFDLRPEHERAVLEMGMYTTGEIMRLCEITEPEIGVITMIGPVHLARAKTMDTIIAAKRELVEALPATGTAILNRDDDRVMEMAPYTQANIFTYGLDDTADLWADNIHSMGLSGIRFTLHHQHESLSLSVPILGRHSVHTALRATAIGLVEGLSWEEIANGLNETTLAEFRLVAVPGPRRSVIIDDTYNSSPDSAMAALNLLAELDGRHIAVLGDMLELGWAEEESHRLVGRRAAEVAQILIGIGPRSQKIVQEARKVGMTEANVYWVETATEAIPLLEEMIQKGDAILVKGSLGMRLDQIVSAIGRLD